MGNEISRRQDPPTLKGGRNFGVEKEEERRGRSEKEKKTTPETNSRRRLGGSERER